MPTREPGATDPMPTPGEGIHPHFLAHGNIRAGMSLAAMGELPPMPTKQGSCHPMPMPGTIRVGGSSLQASYPTEKSMPSVSFSGPVRWHGSCLVAVAWIAGLVTPTHVPALPALAPD